jgi:hypothetical protein
MRVEFRKAFHRAKSSGVIPSATRIKHLSEGWFAIELTLTQLNHFCQLNGFHLTMEESGCRAIVMTEAA